MPEISSRLNCLAWSPAMPGTFSNARRQVSAALCGVEHKAGLDRRFVVVIGIGQRTSARVGCDGYGRRFKLFFCSAAARRTALPPAA